MSLGILSDEEFEQEIAEQSNNELPTGLVRDRNTRGPLIPEPLKKIIGEEAIESDASQKEIAEAFGVTQTSVHSFANGRNGTNPEFNRPNQSLRKHINGVKEKISKKASNRLNLALNNITEEKFSEAKLVEIAQVARAMSSIVKDMEPSDESRLSNSFNAPVIFMAPPIRKEDSFEYIDVSARDE